MSRVGQRGDNIFSTFPNKRDILSQELFCKPVSNSVHEEEPCFEYYFTNRSIMYI